MPYTIAERDGKQCIFHKGDDGQPTGDSLGCHASREEAQNQIAAIWANERKAIRMTQAMVAKICPSCAEEMGRKGIASLNLNLMGELPPAFRASMKPATDPGFFTHCMEEIAPETDVDDPEAFCAWLHNKLLGIWPAEERALRPTVKALGDWELDVLAIPYGGPNKGKDEHGEYFDENTDLDLKHFSKPPVHYYHGYDPEGRPQGKPELIGEVTNIRKDTDGVWYRVLLDKAKDFARRVWEAARANTARASSGSINHLVRRGKDGHLDYWPVAELSLFDADGTRQPANAYAVALPVMKALYEEAGLTFPTIDEGTSAQKAIGEEQRRKAEEAKLITNRLSKQEETMDEKELEGKVSAAVKAALDAQSAAAEAKAAAAQEEKTRLDAAIKAERDKWEADEVAKRRLPFGVPYVAKVGDSHYDHLDAGDQAVLVGVLTAAGKRPSETAIKSLAAKLEGDKSGVGEMGRQAMKMAGMKANEIDYSTYQYYGDEWVGVAYSQAIWESIRHATFVANKLPTIEVPQGMESISLPLEGTDPVFYKVAEATAIDSTLKVPAATVTNSPLGTGTTRPSLTLAKLGGRVIWTGELDEGSLIPFANQLRSQLVTAGAEYLESALIDGDTETGASANINDIDGTAGTTDWFMVWNGFRKSPLVTTTANKRSAGGSLDITDYLETVKLMGTGGVNGFDRNKVGFIVDIPTHYKTSTLPEVLTRDVFVSPTIEGGVLSKIFGYSLNTSAQICKNGGAGGLSEATGKASETASHNLYGQILAVRWDQWKFGWRRRMTLETTRIANADSTEIVALMRCGLIQRDTEAAAITYYVGC